jgi:hypothetical protein
MAITPNSTDDLNKRGFQRLMRWSRGVDHSQFGPTPQARRGSKIDWTSAAKDALLCGSAGESAWPPARLKLAPRRAGFKEFSA